MKYDVFANIMAMYPTTPTKEIADLFGISSKFIAQLASSMGVYKEGRKHKGRCKNNVVIYNARTAEVHFQFGDTYKVRISKKPVKLQVKWENL